MNRIEHIMNFLEFENKKYVNDIFQKYKIYNQMKKRLIKEKINDYKSNAEIKDIIDIYHSKHSCSQTNKKDKLVSNKCDIQCSKKKKYSMNFIKKN